MSELEIKKVGEMFKVFTVFVMSAVAGIALACAKSYFDAPGGTSNETLHASLAYAVTFVGAYFTIRFTGWIWRHFYSPSPSYYASRQSESP